MEQTEIALIPRLMPSVVNIAFSRLDPAPGSTSGGTDVAATSPRRVRGVGSGFIVSPDGEIVTNNHVVAGAYEINVTLQDGRTLRAHVIGASEISDIALIKINPGESLPVVKIGDSDTLSVGQPVLAIGNPLGLGGTVTSGIVSALNRDIATTNFDHFIQTDAAINHGNSGGPLFDADGAVIGINTSIYSPTADSGSIGLGFAIPINDAKFVVDRLRRYGRVRPGYIGVSYQQVTPDVAEALRMPGTVGAIVSTVEPGSPAAKAGLQVADIIIGYNHDHPRDTRALTRDIIMTPFGSVVPLELWREGKTFTVPVDIIEAPYSRATGSDMQSADRRAAVTKAFDLGLRLVPVTDDWRGKFHLAADQRGVVVASVASGGVAAEHGVVAGDVITFVQREPVGTPDEAMARIDRIRSAGGKRVLLLVQGQDGLRWITLPLQDEDNPPALADSGRDGRSASATTPGK
jgi:serine protease Do